MRRSFANAWDEISYLYDRVVYWLYGKNDRTRAMRYRTRFRTVLRKLSAHNEGIVVAECQSLLAELDDDLAAAIRYREKEIRLIRKLWQSHQRRPLPPEVLAQHSPEALSDRLDLLAILYDRAGRLDDAIRSLEESQRVCREHGIRFDGDDVLAELTADRRSAAAG